MTEIQLVITLKQGQGVEVHGPIQDKVLCYGLLEAAKDAIRDFRPPGGGLVVPTIELREQNGNR